MMNFWWPTAWDLAQVSLLVNKHRKLATELVALVPDLCPATFSKSLLFCLLIGKTETKAHLEKCKILYVYNHIPWRSMAYYLITLVRRAYELVFNCVSWWQLGLSTVFWQDIKILQVELKSVDIGRLKSIPMAELLSEKLQWKTCLTFICVRECRRVYVCVLGMSNKYHDISVTNTLFFTLLSKSLQDDIDAHILESFKHL